MAEAGAAECVCACVGGCVGDELGRGVRGSAEIGAGAGSEGRAVKISGVDFWEGRGPWREGLLLVASCQLSPPTVTCDSSYCMIPLIKTVLLLCKHVSISYTHSNVSYVNTAGLLLFHTTSHSPRHPLSCAVLLTDCCLCLFRSAASSFELSHLVQFAQNPMTVQCQPDPWI